MSNPDWYYDPPEERAVGCTCGHSQEDHLANDKELAATNFSDPIGLLKLVREVVETLNNGTIPTSQRIGAATEQLNEYLKVCGVCLCQKFEPNDDDPDDDGDSAFDSARDDQIPM